MRPASAISAIMRSGKIPLASSSSLNGTVRSLGMVLSAHDVPGKGVRFSRLCPERPSNPQNMGFYGLSDGRLDGKGASEYQQDLSRGDLSRPACSHVKQVAKQAGDNVIPACGGFSRPVFL